MPVNFFEKHKPNEILRNPKLMAMFADGITSYMRAGVYDGNTPLTYEEGKKYLEKKLTANIGATAPSFITQPQKPKVVRVDDLLPETDTRYLRIFNTIPSDSEAEIYQKAKQSITIKKISEGEEVEFAGGISGEEITVKNITWAAGIRMPRTWFEDNKIYQISNFIQNAKRQFLNNKAGFFYGLIKAQNYDTATIDTTNYDTVINSLNDAYAKVKRKAQADLIGKTIYILCSPEQATIFEQAKVDSLIKGERGARLRFNYEIIDTVHLNPDDPAEMVIGKADQYYQLRQPLKADQDFKIGTLEVEIVFSERFNGVILSTDYGLKLNIQ